MLSIPPLFCLRVAATAPLVRVAVGNRADGPTVDRSAVLVLLPPLPRDVVSVPASPPSPVASAVLKVESVVSASPWLTL